MRILSYIQINSLTTLLSLTNVAIALLATNDDAACSSAIGTIKANETLAVHADTRSSLQKRSLTLLSDIPNQQSYARTLWRRIALRDQWVDLSSPNGQTKNQAWRFPDFLGESYLGIRDLAGNTAVLIMTRTGIFISLIYDIPTFRYRDESGNLQERDELGFWARSYSMIRFGDRLCQGTGPGIEHLRNRGSLFYEETPTVPHPITISIVTPQPLAAVRGSRIPYNPRIELLQNNLSNLFPSVGGGRVDVVGYHQSSRVAIEIDTFEGVLRNPPPGIRHEYGTWRLWVGQRAKKQGYFTQDA
ncbi:hypothetical protein EV356DRAFT_389959 [Viridothelium virens]|uniref:Uncharacterized protein n=1 Tax=Viridothelium virens TaxID=1048519 RepID=A0A6A6GUL6_VIRVR|nr:hypothetical protein EV356DRAFT_389959 [Viridothelium virens]